MKTNNLILIPTDFSEVCDNAVYHGVNLAKSLNYSVYLLHVIDKNTKTILKKENVTYGAVNEKLAEIAAKYNKELGVSIHFGSREGTIFDIIPDVAAELGAKLMILGTHGKVGIQQHLAGSYAQKIVTSSHCPTIVVQKRSFDHGYKTIIFPINEITEVRQKVQWTIKIAKLFDATVHIVQVNKGDDFQKKTFSIISQQVEELFNRHQVKHSHIIIDGPGSVQDEVISYAVSKRADFIMIMAETAYFNFFTTNVEQMIFNDAQIPVMCIHPIQLGEIEFN